MKLLKIVWPVVISFICIQAFAVNSIRSELTGLTPKIAGWVQQSAIVTEIQKANSEHQNYSKSQIKQLNTQWKHELKSSNRPLISKVNNNGLSSLLQKIQEQSNGLYQGILLTDQYGLVIGQTYIPSQYAQASQTSWKKAFAASLAKPYIAVGHSKKAKVKPAVVSMPITDNNGKTIGVVEVNIDQAKLGGIAAQS